MERLTFLDKAQQIGLFLSAFSHSSCCNVQNAELCPQKAPLRPPKKTPIPTASHSKAAHGLAPTSGHPVFFSRVEISQVGFKKGPQMPQTPSKTRRI